MSDKCVKALIMAGGIGSRLRPLTYTIPKPLLPVGRKPILQIIIEQLKKCGITNIFITVEYKAELIKSYFEDGNEFGVKITYIDEDGPRGTAGSVKFIEGMVDEPFIVMNGDLLTKLDFMDIWRLHVESGAEFTVGIKEYKIKFPYGLVNLENGKILNITEKPELTFYINAGIYVLSPSALEVVPKDHFFDMPDAIQALINQDRNVGYYEIKEYWRDVGKMEDYQEIKNGVKEWE